MATGFCKWGFVNIQSIPIDFNFNSNVLVKVYFFIINKFHYFDIILMWRLGFVNVVLFDSLADFLGRGGGVI